MEVMEKYKLNPELTERQLQKEGFSHGIYKRCIFKTLVQLVIYVDMDERWWSFQVRHTGSDTLYAPYYDRAWGVNDVAKEINQKVEDIIKDMEKRNILKKK